MYNPAQITGKQQGDMMRKKFNISSSNQSKLRTLAAKSPDKSVRFWGQRLGKKTMTGSQVKDVLNKLSKEKGAPDIKNIDTRVEGFKTEEKKIEQQKIKQAEKERIKETSVKYRKYLHKREENPEFRDIRKDLRDDMEKREQARLSGVSEKAEKEEKTNSAVISVSSLSTKKKEDNSQDSFPETSINPPDLPLD